MTEHQLISLRAQLAGGEWQSEDTLVAAVFGRGHGEWEYYRQVWQALRDMGAESRNLGLNVFAYRLPQVARNG